MKNGVLSQLSFRQLREYPILCQMCCYHFIHQSLHNVHLLCLFFMIFLLFFGGLTSFVKKCFNYFFRLHVLVDPPHFLKIDFTIILILHILVDSPLSRFLEMIIGLVYRLDLLVLVVPHQVHLFQVLHQH